jgi:anti-sigma B factor antagonist
MAPHGSLQYEIETSKDDEYGNKVTTIACHGKLVIENARQMNEVVKPLIPLGGRIVVDLGDLSYLDSAGLGTLLGLKVSAIKQGYCKLEFVNMTPRVLELLRLTNVLQMFSS